MSGRSIRSLVFFVLILLVSEAFPLPASDEGEDQFTFFVLADPQLGMTADNKDFRQETENMEKAIAAANRLKPAFVVVLGDLVNREGDPRQVAEYKRLAARLDPSIPLYNVAGNHDVGTAATKDSLAGYRTRFGPDYFAFETHDVIGLVLNTSLIKTVQGMEEEKARQKAWLEGELRKAGEKRRRVLLFQHIPWFLADPDETEKYENIGPAARREYLDLLRSSTVSHVFAGHRHMNGRAKIGAIEMLIVGPVGKPLGPDPSGILLVTVGAEGLTCRYVALDDLPAR